MAALALPAEIFRASKKGRLRLCNCSVGGNRFALSVYRLPLQSCEDLGTAVGLVAGFDEFVGSPNLEAMQPLLCLGINLPGSSRTPRRPWPITQAWRIVIINTRQQTCRHLLIAKAKRLGSVWWQLWIEVGHEGECGTGHRQLKRRGGEVFADDLLHQSHCSDSVSGDTRPRTKKKSLSTSDSH